MNTTLFHEEIDEVFLLLTNLAEVVKVVPDVQIEVFLDTRYQNVLASLGDVVVGARVVALAIGDTNCDLVFLLTRR